MQRQRQQQIFAELLDSDRRQTSRMFFWLLILQWAFAVLVAVVISPLAWEGRESRIHEHVWMAAGLGTIITILPLHAVRRHPSSLVTAHIVAAAQMLMGSLLIHLTGGRIETHFHVFGSLAFLAFYRNVPVLVNATVIVALDHFLRGALFPDSVFGAISADWFRTAEHAAWVVFEDIFLVIACRQKLSDLRATARQQSALEQTNEIIERSVRERTHELEESRNELAATERHRRELNTALADRVSELAVMNTDLIAARDRAEEAARLKSEFLANMSHELRTPLNGVIGMTDLALNTSPGSEQLEYLQQVKRSSHHLLGVINDILDFSRVQAGKLKIESEAFSISEVVQDVVRMLSIEAQQKSLALRSAISEEVPGWLVGDPLRLRQVLTNLAGNAVKFTEYGQVSIHVGFQSNDRASGMLHLAVSDTGIGIPTERQAAIFDPFVQVDGSSTRKHGGAGLGLSITAQLVKLMEGVIGVGSSPGTGSTFTVRIPVKVSPAPPAAAHQHSNAPAVAAPLPPNGYRILLAEDNVVNQRLARRLLELQGYSVSLANDGVEAIDAFAAASFDLILMDVQMPRMGGYEAVARIRELEQSRKTRTPIIALTAHALLGERERCLAAGMDEYLSKPIDRLGLFAKIEAVLRTAESPVIVS